MKALTIRQPGASLIALGVKKIETLSWSTSYRGPLAIHAAKTFAGFDAIAHGTEAGWRYGELGDLTVGFQAAYCHRSSDEGRRGDTFLHCIKGPDATNEPGPCPLGVIVATCTLAEVVPILACGQDPSPGVDDRWVPHVAETRALEAGELWHWIGRSEHENLSTGRPTWRFADVSDQRPYGDFTPGRFAWLLENVTPAAPVPATGRLGLWEWTDSEEVVDDA